MHMGGAKECPPIERSCAISKPDAKGKVSLSSLPVPPSPFTLRFRLSLSLSVTLLMLRMLGPQPTGIATSNFTH